MGTGSVPTCKNADSKKKKKSKKESEKKTCEGTLMETVPPMQLSAQTTREEHTFTMNNLLTPTSDAETTDKKKKKNKKNKLSGKDLAVLTEISTSTSLSSQTVTVNKVLGTQKSNDSLTILSTQNSDDNQATGKKKKKKDENLDIEGQQVAPEVDKSLDLISQRGEISSHDSKCLSILNKIGYIQKKA